jgi:hypothetical protein
MSTECIARDLTDALHDALTSEERCFASGSFVIDDPAHKTYMALIDATCKSYVRLGGRTHAVYLSTKQFDALKPKGSRARLLRANRGRWIIQREIYDRGLSDRLCGQPKTTMLFYPFSVSVDARVHDFLFLKYENHPYWHYRHAISAIQHYVMGKKSKATWEQRSSARREDHQCLTKNIGNLVCGAENTVWYDDHVRTGCEMYVSACRLGRALKRHRKQ